MDPKTIGGLFYLLCDEIKDINFVTASRQLWAFVQQLMNAPSNTSTNGPIHQLQEWIDGLPKLYQGFFANFTVRKLSQLLRIIEESRLNEETVEAITREKIFSLIFHYRKLLELDVSSPLFNQDPIDFIELEDKLRKLKAGCLQHGKVIF